ncbi:MAG: thiamine pyrophosphate-binding protein [Rhodospirillaceae bacterium]|jgi:acetolactate synthase I/II/III large subunit|nr:thiamine pyrophosphate-binding protein [Rhodospirillaceae bacterium]MBT5459793.1 thiamine pyrophosphate-binding protein [Rhodospirillaceae bacterium]
MQNAQDGGEAILEAFRNLHVDYILSSPGSEWGPVWEALARQKVGNKPGPTYLSCGHETLAVNLAWGYTTVTGRMQAVLLHAGAGLLQGSMGIHAANVTGTPMVVMSGESLSFGENPDFDPGRQWFGSLSIVGGPHRLMEPIVKWANQATSSATLYEQVVRAGEMAQRTPAGPTYVNVPIENMLHDWTPPDVLRDVPTAPKQRASDADIDAVAQKLVSAKKPLIITEAAGREPEGFAALVDLAELLAIPVVENSNGRFANFPKTHGLHQGFNVAAQMEGADLVLPIRSYAPWYPPSNGPKNATVVAIDECPVDGKRVYQNLQANAYLEGDVPSSLELLADAVRVIGFDSAAVEERRSSLQAAHDALHEDYREAEEKAAAESPIDPVHLCARMSAILPDNVVYVDETTTHRMPIQRHLQWNAPHDYIKVPTGLGQGLGTALGVKLACPDRPVVSIIGDGGFQYNPVTQSLSLSMAGGLPILIVVFNNQGYLAMKNNHHSYYPEATAAQNDLYLGHPIDDLDYAELVRPFGGVGLRVDDPAKLDGVLQEGLAAVEAGKTTIINAILCR